MTIIDPTPIEVPTGIVHDNVNPRMDTAVRDLWIAGLRSGLYKEGRGALRTLDDLYDPFGVLCDIAAQLGIVSWDHNKHENVYHIYGYRNHVPYPVREWAGFKGMHPSQDVPLTWEHALHPLWRLVDWHKLDHTIIADLIEMQY